MYNTVLIIHVILALLLCIFVFFAQTRVGGVRDFTTNLYSASALLTQRSANVLLLRVISFFTAAFFVTSLSLVVIDKHETNRMRQSITHNDTDGANVTTDGQR